MRWLNAQAYIRPPEAVPPLEMSSESRQYAARDTACMQTACTINVLSVGSTTNSAHALERQRSITLFFEWQAIEVYEDTSGAEAFHVHLLSSSHDLIPIPNDSTIFSS